MKHLSPTLRPIQTSQQISNLFFTSEGLEESFEDVYVITLKSHFYEKALESALESMTIINVDELDQTIKQCARQLIIEKKIKVDGFVEVADKLLMPRITVCLPGEEVNEEVIYEATRRIAVALDYLEGQDGIVYFERDVQFDVKDLPLLNAH